ncbi:MAG: toprim domain-containing protein [Leptolyngbyaceae cyanobacterium RM2_2_4]|nr:toprim domain-containing protein [Leptolyngbyaceae cyanobacterium RM2_2_4]
MRLLNPKTDDDGEIQKMDTLPGTRLGYLFYGWSQDKLPPQIRGVIVTEGSFNALAIQQALNKMYGGVTRNPWRVIAASGSGATTHQREVLKELKDAGYKVVVSPDTDKAGLHMLQKMKETDSMTHYALTGDQKKDWNDCLKEMGHDEFAKFFISRIKSVKK